MTLKLTIEIDMETGKYDLKVKTEPRGGSIELSKLGRILRDILADTGEQILDHAGQLPPF